MMVDAARVLVIDDERNIRATLLICLESLGCEVTAVESGDAALTALGGAAFDLCFLDLRLGADDGLELLPRLLAIQPQLAIILITAYATVDAAVMAVERGAVAYLPKPFDPAQIRHVIEHASRHIAERCRTMPP